MAGKQWPLTDAIRINVPSQKTEVGNERFIKGVNSTKMMPKHLTNRTTTDRSV